MWARLIPPSGRDVDIVTLGENSLDFVAVAAPGTTVAGKRRLSRFDLFPGGQTATAAVACARLGLKARYIGAFGDDEWAARGRRTLEHEGVELVAIVHAGCASRVAVVLVDQQGERTVLEHREDALTIEPIPEGAIESARLLLVDATDMPAAETAVARAHEMGMPTLVDVDRLDDRTEALLEGIDVIIVPVPFLEVVTGMGSPGAGLARLASRFPGASAVIATLGEDGSLALVQGREIATPGFRVTVRDTTGAGDAFRAGFAAAWLSLGPHAPIEALLRRANATAALNCRSIGAQTGLPTVAEVDRLVTG
jgi:sugar/nucleoside kinase (ribokinase family)